MESLGEFIDLTLQVRTHLLFLNPETLVLNISLLAAAARGEGTTVGVAEAVDS
jgi:hypothetical protein